MVVRLQRGEDGKDDSQAAGRAAKGSLVVAVPVARQIFWDIDL